MVDPDGSGDEAIKFIGPFSPDSHQTTLGLGRGPKGDHQLLPFIVPCQGLRYSAEGLAYPDDLYLQTAFRRHGLGPHIRFENIFCIGC